MMTRQTDSSTETTKSTIIGIVLAFATTVAIVLLPIGYAMDVLAILLAIIGAIYIGFALADGRKREVRIEITAAIFTIALAVAGLWFSPYYLIVGYVFHGVWDILHHPRLVQTKVVEWYPPICVVYDWIVAAFILFWWSGIIS